MSFIRFAQPPGLASDGRLRWKPAVPGGALMHWAQTSAQCQGYRELAVDTAEPAENLVAFHARRGYRFIELRSGRASATVVLFSVKSLPKAF